MDEGEVTQPHHLGVARCEGSHLHRYTSKDRNGPLGGGSRGGEESRVPCRRRQRQQGGMGGDFLDKGKVRAMRLKEGAQASKIGHVVCVEGEEGEERPVGLAIVSMSRHRHLDWNQKCAEREGSHPPDFSLANHGLRRPFAAVCCRG
jgi:hypothetical protein